MAKRFINYPWPTDVVTTADATPTVSAATSYVVPTDTVGNLEMRALLKGPAGIVGVAYINVPFRNVGGVLTLIAPILFFPIGGELLAAAIDATKSGTTIQPRVTGIIATAIEWQLDCRYSVN